jgi:hypothetical protein
VALHFAKNAGLSVPVGVVAGILFPGPALILILRTLLLVLVVAPRLLRPI